MAFTSFDQLLTNASQTVHISKVRVGQDAPPVLASAFLMAGSPSPVAFAPGINGAALSYTGSQGELVIANPSGGTERKLAGVVGATPFTFDFWLCDRLWHNSGLSVTTITEQAMAPVGIPARDVDGATAGNGVWAALEVDTAATNAAAITNCTIRFTDQAGTANLVGAPVARIPATANSRSFLVFSMPAGSTGVRSIEGITLGTSLVTGSINLVLFRPLAIFGNAGQPTALAGTMRHSALMLNAPTIPSGAVLFVVDGNATTGSTAHLLSFTFAEA